jgi:hypothetical protein
MCPIRDVTYVSGRSHGITTLPIMTDEMDAALIRLQFVAYHQRRAEPALADDLEAVIRYAKSDPASRQIDPEVLTRLERREGQATVENQSSLANDLIRAVELVRKLKGTEG